MTEPTSDLVKVNAFARRFEKEIGEAVSKKFRHGALMTALVILRVVENILITNTSRMFKVGGSEGMEHIKKVYDGAQKDCIERWNNLDLNNKPRLIK